jgi:NADPH-dependent curcumin reductase CurA
VNRFWRLDRHPDGNDFAAAFSLAEEPLRSPADGEVLVRNRISRSTPAPVSG